MIKKLRKRKKKLSKIMTLKFKSKNLEDKLEFWPKMTKI